MPEESAQAVNWKECRAFQEDCKRERKEDIAAVYEAQRRSSSELAAEQREFNKALIQRVDNTISALSTQVGRLASSVAKLEGRREGKEEGERERGTHTVVAVEDRPKTRRFPWGLKEMTFALAAIAVIILALGAVFKGNVGKEDVVKIVAEVMKAQGKVGTP